MIPSTQNSAPRARWISLLTWGLLLVIWQLASGSMPSAVLPSPLETAAALGDLVGESRFYDHLGTTLRRGVIGFGGALLLGTVAGLLMGWWTTAYHLLRPLTQLTMSVPPIIWIALLLIWLGMGDGPPLIVVVLTTTPLVALTVAHGVHDLDPELLEMARVFRFGRWRTLRHVVLPGLRSSIASAVLLALGFTWRVLVMAEFLGSTSGLGNRLSWARQNLNTEDALAYTVVILALSLLIEGVVRWLLLRPRAWQSAATTLLPETHRHESGIHTHPATLHSNEKAHEQ